MVAKRAVHQVEQVDCPHIECDVCEKVEHEARLRSPWMRATIRVVSRIEGDGFDGDETIGLVCSVRCFRLWSRSVEERLPIEAPPRRGRPRKRPTTG